MFHHKFSPALHLNPDLDIFRNLHLIVIFCFSFQTVYKVLKSFLMNLVAPICHLLRIEALTWEPAKIVRSELIDFHSLTSSPTTVIRQSRAPPLTFDFSTIIRTH